MYGILTLLGTIFKADLVANSDFLFPFILWLGIQYTRISFDLEMESNQPRSLKVCCFFFNDNKTESVWKYGKVFIIAFRNNVKC